MSDVVGRWRGADINRPSPLTGFLNSGFHSRRGEQAQAANWSRAALEALPWSDDMIVSEEGGWQVFLDDSLDYMVAFVQQADPADFAGELVLARVIISHETWETLADYDAAAINHFMSEMKAGGTATGMRFIVKDAPPIASAIRKQAAAAPVTKDVFVELEERANSLVVQAASLNRSPTDTQRQIFAVRLAEMQRDYAELQERVATLGGIIQLAGTAVFDASTH